jgi:hypothetical protein
LLFSTFRQPLPSRADGKQILVNVTPGPGSVTVRW